MSIQSTQDVSREAAILRIYTIATLVAEKNFVDIYIFSFDPDFNVREFVENTDSDKLVNLHMWTNGMLEDQLDKPFFRWSMFENYLIEEDNDED